MKIVVLSCDKNTDTFEPFHHCMEKYWSGHPEIIYYTESVINPYYKTIPVPHELNEWTRGLREFLKQIDDPQILIIVDDAFIRAPVDEARLQYAAEHLTGNIAMFNMEKSFDKNDEDTGLIGFKKRQHGSSYEVSIMCGLWQKDKLLQVISNDCSPWDVEYGQNNCNFDYYINSGEYIIDWGYKYWQPVGIQKGKWTREVVDFFESEGLTVDYSKRGFVT